MTHSSTPQRAMRFCSPWTPLWTLKKKKMPIWGLLEDSSSEKGGRRKKGKQTAANNSTSSFLSFYFHHSFLPFSTPSSSCLRGLSSVWSSGPVSSLIVTGIATFIADMITWTQIALICQWLHCLLNKLIVNLRLKKEPQTFIDVPVLMRRPFMLFYRHLLWIKTCVRVGSPLIPLPSLFLHGTWLLGEKKKSTFCPHPNFKKCLA